jgi:hypothetical protein
MTTYTYNCELSFKKWPIVVGKYHPKYDGTTDPVMLDYPNWVGYYSDGGSEYVLKNETGGTPNDVLANILRTKFKCNFTWWRSGTSIGKVKLSNADVAVEADFKYDDYSYSVTNSSGTVKGGNLRTVLDKFVANYTNLGEYKAKFSDVVTTVVMTPCGGIVANKESATVKTDNPVTKTTAKTDAKPPTKAESDDEPMPASSLFPDDDDGW